VKSFCTVLFLLFVLLGEALASPDSIFEKGVDAYRQGDMEEACQTWESLYDQGYVSGALCYNLGNAHFRLGHTAKALIFYERARKLLPRDRDVRTNLMLARMAVVDRVDAPVRLVVWNWVDAVRDYFSEQELQHLLVWLGVAAALSVIAVTLFRPRVPRAIPIVICALWLLCGALFVWRSITDSVPRAIIAVAKVDVKSAPDESSKDVFALHEGLKVRVRTNLAGWLKIELADGRRGWIPATEAEQI
jgi:tetratricopeptide (TPR) repeat protein